MAGSSYNPYSLEGKRVLITGASSGIGRTCAIECSKLGAKVVLVARREAELRETLSMMDGEGHTVEPFDLSRGEWIENWIKEVVERSGPLDGLLHSAGVAPTLPLRATSRDSFQKVIALNLESAFLLCKAFRLRGVRAASGSIVMISSVMGLVGQPGLVAYSASKGALVAMAKSLALELAKEHIRVNIIAPGHVQTAITKNVQGVLPEEVFKTIKANHPLGIGRPEDVAWAVAYFFSDASRWITGTTLVVDGGYTAA